jgi:hypothetical protein
MVKCTYRAVLIMCQQHVLAFSSLQNQEYQDRQHVLEAQEMCGALNQHHDALALDPLRTLSASISNAAPS